jgi:hypothetical protein
MNKKRVWISGVIIAILTVGGYLLWTGVPGKTPPGQMPLVELNTTTLNAMKADFNRASGSVRVITLLSPT